MSDTETFTFSDLRPSRSIRNVLVAVVVLLGFNVAVALASLAML